MFDDGVSYTWYDPDGHMSSLYNLDGTKNTRRTDRKRSESWILNDLYHREDGPAYSLYHFNGLIDEEKWYIRGMHHREDGPAWIERDEDGSLRAEYWYIDGVEFRLYGPSGRAWENGVKVYERWNNYDLKSLTIFCKRMGIPSPDNWEKWTNEDKLLIKLSFI